MNKDEQLIIQVLDAYQNGKIDFSNVPELELIVQKEVNKEFRYYQENMARLANQKTEATLQELKTEAQEKLNRLDLNELKAELLKEIQDEKNDLLALKKEIHVQREKTNADNHREALESYGIIIANVVCLLCFLVVGALLGQWIYKGIWDGWGLHILYDTVISLQSEHPYGAVVLGLGGFVLIAFGIYGSFKLMYVASTSWLDTRPKIFQRIFPKK